MPHPRGFLLFQPNNCVVCCNNSPGSRFPTRTLQLLAIFTARKNKTFLRVVCSLPRSPKPLDWFACQVALLSSSLVLFCSLSKGQNPGDPDPAGQSAWLGILLTRLRPLGPAGQLPSHCVSHLAAFASVRRYLFNSLSKTQSPAPRQGLRISKWEVQGQTPRCGLSPAFLYRLLQRLYRNFLDRFPSGFIVSNVKKMGRALSRQGRPTSWAFHWQRHDFVQMTSPGSAWFPSQ